MNRRIISALLVFLLLTSVAMPAVAAGDPSEVYYELHDMCIMNAHKDLGKIPFSFGIGYEGRQIADTRDTWVIFIHAGAVTKKFTLTPETSMKKLMLIKDFVTNVNVCKEESDQIPNKLRNAIAEAVAGGNAVMYGTAHDYAPAIAGGLLAAAHSVTEATSALDHFGKAKTAQVNAEKLFHEL